MLEIQFFMSCPPFNPRERLKFIFASPYFRVWLVNTKSYGDNTEVMGQKQASPTRLTRDEWLARALDILALEGGAKLRVDAICDALGVTKGSFYWHFKDRDDFVRSVVQFWSTRFTDPVLARIAEMGGAANARLKSLMRFVSEGGFARYDVCVRAWAMQDPDLVAAIVKDVDERRLAFCRVSIRRYGLQGSRRRNEGTRLRRLSEL
jgi:AcrR family transcriptional regulator